MYIHRKFLIQPHLDLNLIQSLLLLPSQDRMAKKVVVVVGGGVGVVVVVTSRGQLFLLREKREGE